MKSSSINLYTLCALLVAAGTSPSLLAQNTTPQNDWDNPTTGRSSQMDSTQNPRSSTQRSQPNASQVRVTRASNFLGTDVIANDGRKVGDIVDYFFDLGSPQHLAYVVVMTGGFLNMGGDTRAVPASAINVSGDNCRLSIGSDQFWDVPVLPENRQRFLSDSQHRQRISQVFNQSARSSGSTSSWDSNPNQQTGSTSVQTTTGSSSDEDQAGGMTGRVSGQSQTRLVSFNELRNSDAFGQQDTRLGFIQDAWINLNENRAPYIEITPTFQPFRTNFDRRYAIPTTKIAQKREHYGYTLNVTPDELNQAQSVSETEGVRMLEEGRVGNTVLRVTVPAANR